MSFRRQWKKSIWTIIGCCGFEGWLARDQRHDYLRAQITSVRCAVCKYEWRPADDAKRPRNCKPKQAPETHLDDLDRESL